MDASAIRGFLEALGSRTIKEHGTTIMASCPLSRWTHSKGSDDNPSFQMGVVAGGDSWWKCYACNQSGKHENGLLVAIKKVGGSYPAQARNYLTRYRGGGGSDGFQGQLEEKRAETLRQLRGWSSTFEAPGVVLGLQVEYDYCKGFIPEYVRRRGVTDALALRWEIGYDPRSKRVFIPVRSRKGDLVGWSKRSIYEDALPKYLHAPGFDRQAHLYGENLIDPSVRAAVISEGFFDVWRLDRFGIRNAMATMGISPGAGQVDTLATFERVLILRHNDERPVPLPGQEQKLSAGEEMAQAYGTALRERGVQVMIGPTIKGRKDPGEMDIHCLRAVWSRVGAFLMGAGHPAIEHESKNGGPHGQDDGGAGHQEGEEAEGAHGEALHPGEDCGEAPY